MYCSSCGNKVKKGLNYCNSCGARVLDIEKEKSGGRMENVSTAIGFIGIGGIVGFIFLIRILLENKVDSPVIVILSLAFLGTIFGLVYLLVKQLSDKSINSEQNVEFENTFPKSIKSADTNQLQQPKHNPASVVENTTRTLDKVPIERS